tara:strand:+ start:122 stop:289 length:168 start_codon:yes stop_codon:yes gene_type:complete
MGYEAEKQQEKSNKEIRRRLEWERIKKEMRKERDQNANVEDPASLKRTREKGIAY